MKKQKKKTLKLTSKKVPVKAASEDAIGLNSIEKKVRKYLVNNIASKQNLIGYEELNQACNLGLDFDKGSDRLKVGTILGNISQSEHDRHAPLLSVIVVHKERNVYSSPDKPFFQLARDLGKYDADCAEIVIFAKETQLVYQYWHGKKI